MKIIIRSRVANGGLKCERIGQCIVEAAECGFCMNCLVIAIIRIMPPWGPDPRIGSVVKAILIIARLVILVIQPTQPRKGVRLGTGKSNFLRKRFYVSLDGHQKGTEVESNSV